MNMHIKVSGEYNLVVTRPDGSTIETGWFDNLILDQGLDYMGEDSVQYGPVLVNNCHVGTGTSIPLVTQTSLDARIAGTGYSYWGNYSPPAVTVNLGTPTYASQTTYTFVFSQGAVVGNITEVGVGGDAGNGTDLFSRALILDGGGSPTSMTLLLIDQLTVYYRIKFLPTLTDSTGSVSISSISYGYTGRFADAGGTLVYFSGRAVVVGITVITVYAAGSALGAITSHPSGSATGGATYTKASYTPGSYYRDSTCSMSVGQANVTGGIQGILIQSGGSGVINYQYHFDTPIPKDNTKVLSLTFRISWGRV